MFTSVMMDRPVITRSVVFLVILGGITKLNDFILPDKTADKPSCTPNYLTIPDNIFIQQKHQLLALKLIVTGKEQ